MLCIVSPVVLGLQKPLAREFHLPRRLSLLVASLRSAYRAAITELYLVFDRRKGARTVVWKVHT